MRSILIIAALMFSTASGAAPVTWTLNDVTFEDGRTATGWFVYDAGSNSYLDFSISVEAGPGGIESGSLDIRFEALTYTPGNSSVTVGDSFNFFGAVELFQTHDCWAGSIADACAQNLQLSFGDFRTDSGGVVQLQTKGCVGPCNDTTETAIEVIQGLLYTDPQDLVSGYITAVPIPAAVWLFGSALAGLGWLRRRQTA